MSGPVALGLTGTADLGVGDIMSDGPGDHILSVNEGILELDTNQNESIKVRESLLGCGDECIAGLGKDSLRERYERREKCGLPRDVVPMIGVCGQVNDSCSRLRELSLLSLYPCSGSVCTYRCIGKCRHLKIA